MNRLLAVLPLSERIGIEGSAERVRFDREQPLWQQGEPLSAFYLPTTAVISLIQRMDGGLSLELASVGHEGIVGPPSFAATPRALSDAVCQVAGEAWKLTEPQFRSLRQANHRFEQLYARYTYVLLRELTQSAGCHAVHSAEQRFARMLLEMSDRSPIHPIELSQQFIAEILAVRWETAGLVAAYFERSGLITYSREKIELVDRPGLADVSCECYGILRKELDAVFAGH